MGYHLITCIVERGKADKVVDSALKAGAQAATYFYAQGKGVREKIGFMGKFIMPEKEVVFIVTNDQQNKQVFDEIVKTANLETPGKGFAYIQPVEQAVGFIDM
ncbi:MAG: P-II family nitrogen regulator [Endomicrobiales bacterium]|nr:P-II family nitrogen regulator [Endomicrobiales bacterium]